MTTSAASSLAESHSLADEVAEWAVWAAPWSMKTAWADVMEWCVNMTHPGSVGMTPITTCIEPISMESAARCQLQLVCSRKMWSNTVSQKCEYDPRCKCTSVSKNGGCKQM